MMEITSLATLLIAFSLMFEHGLSGQVQTFEKETISSTDTSPSFRAYQLNKVSIQYQPKTTIAAKSRLTTKASNRPVTTTKRIGQTTKPIKNQQLQKTTPKRVDIAHTGSKTKTKPIIVQHHTTIPRTVLYRPMNREYGISADLLRGLPLLFSLPEDTSPTNVTKRVTYSVTLTPTSATTEDYDDNGNSTSTELPELYDDLTSTSASLNSTEVPDASTVEDATRKRLKRRKTTTSDPATSTKRRLKRTRTTTVGPENA